MIGELSQEGGLSRDVYSRMQALYADSRAVWSSVDLRSSLRVAKCCEILRTRFAVVLQLQPVSFRFFLLFFFFYFVRSRVNFAKSVDDNAERANVGSAFYVCYFFFFILLRTQIVRGSFRVSFILTRVRLRVFSRTNCNLEFNVTSVVIIYSIFSD